MVVVIEGWDYPHDLKSDLGWAMRDEMGSDTFANIIPAVLLLSPRASECKTFLYLSLVR